MGNTGFFSLCLALHHLLDRAFNSYVVWDIAILKGDGERRREGRWRETEGREMERDGVKGDGERWREGRWRENVNEGGDN